MAKKLTITKINSEKINNNSNISPILNLTSSQKNINIDKVQLYDSFANLFMIDENILKEITEDMKRNGYDQSQPLIIWKERNTLIDGHTRLKAARDADISSLPVVYASFESEDDVLDYMHRLQFNRRNITDKELIDLASTAITKYEKSYGKGSKAEFLAKRFNGLSESKAKQILVVLERAGRAVIELIRSDQISIYHAYTRCTREPDYKPIPKETKKGFFDYPNTLIRFDENGSFYFRDYNKERERKIFSLSKEFNKDMVKEKLRLFIEKEILNHEDNEINDYKKT